MRTEFKPELALERNKQAALAMTCASEGYKIVHLIARSEVDKFVLDLLNVPNGAPDEEKLEKLRVSKVAAQLYEGITRRINHEVQQYTLASERPGEPVDPTEGMLDFGPHASRDAVEIRPLEEGNYNEF